MKPSTFKRVNTTVLRLTTMSFRPQLHKPSISPLKTRRLPKERVNPLESEALDVIRVKDVNILPLLE